MRTCLVDGSSQLEGLALLPLVELWLDLLAPQGGGYRGPRRTFRGTMLRLVQGAGVQAYAGLNERASQAPPAGNQRSAPGFKRRGGAPKTRIRYSQYQESPFASSRRRRSRTHNDQWRMCQIPASSGKTPATPVRRCQRTGRGSRHITFYLPCHFDRVKVRFVTQIKRPPRLIISQSCQFKQLGRDA